MLPNNNSWVTIVSLASANTRSMQHCTEDIVCNSDTNITGGSALWQILWLALDASTTVYELRNKGKGPNSALAVSAGPNVTWPGFASYEEKNPTQQWDIVRVGLDGDKELYYLKSIANGTNFNLAEQGNPMSMVSSPMGSNASVASERWTFTVMSEINDPVWSPSPIANNTSSQPSLSSAKQAGISIGVMFICAIVTSLILLGRCWKQKRSARSQQGQGDSERGASASPTDSDREEEKRASIVCVEMPSTPSESSSQRKELSATPVAELPVPGDVARQAIPTSIQTTPTSMRASPHGFLPTWTPTSMQTSSPQGLLPTWTRTLMPVSSLTMLPTPTSASTHTWTLSTYESSRGSVCQQDEIGREHL